MIIGKGLIATAFKKYEEYDDIVIFASGVSNSNTIDDLLFLREKKLLKKTINECKDKVLIYFSSCDIDNYKIDNSYYQHKNNMEKLIKKHCEKFYIFRLPQVVGNTNNLNTLFNFLLSKIYLEEEFIVFEKTSRNIIDIDTVVSLVSYVVDNKLLLNYTTNIAYPLSFQVTDIVEEMTKYLNKKGNFKKVKHKNSCDINVAKIIEIYEILKIEINNNYPKELIEKYADNLIKNLNHSIKNRKVDVVFISDINYIQHLAVAITSLLENNLELISNIYIINNVEKIEEFNELINFINDKYKINITLLKINNTNMYDFKLTHHLTVATYFRLCFSELLPKDINEIIFLDSDIVVLGSLADMIPKDFNQQNYLYAVDHLLELEELSRLKEMNFNGEKYFNAGVLYINLKKWREEKVHLLFQDILNKHNSKILWADQDVLNIAFEDSWGELDFKYNAFGLTEKDDTQDYRIIHYTGSSKPWHFRNKHPYKNLYWKYLKMTPFKRYIPEDLTVINVIKWMIPNKIKEIIKGLKK